MEPAAPSVSAVDVPVSFKKNNSPRHSLKNKDPFRRANLGKNPASVPTAAGSPSETRGGRTNRHTEIEDVDDPDASRKVLVSGFPSYTPSQYLVHVLSELGQATIVRKSYRLAVVMFETIHEAQNAVEAYEELCIYGEFLEIYPYTNAGDVDELYRSFERVIFKEKELDIIHPSKIDLSGDFDQQLENILNAVRLTKEEVAASGKIYVDLETVLRTMWPGCRAVPFGSIPTGLGIKSSDADCYIKGIPLPQEGSASFVNKARRRLSRLPTKFTQLIAVPRANTPILKFLHIPSKRHCDVNAKSPIGSQNSQLIKTILEGDSRLAPLAVVIKYWAKVHFLSGRGRLSNYALVMMIIFYLQQPSVELAPPVVALQSPLSTFEVDHWDAGFRPRPDLISPNSSTMAELLGGFFKFYSNFDFDELVVCPLLGTAVMREAFEELKLPPQMSRYLSNVESKLVGPLRVDTALVVQDPFELCHNVTLSISQRRAPELLALLKFAAEAYVQDSNSFLRTILLTKPVERPSFKMNLIPRVRGDFIDSDWCAVIRRILLDTIFATMLQMKLEKAEEKTPADAKHITKERYSGSTERAVWERTYVRPLANDDTFIKNHTRITERIFQHKKKIVWKFDLELVFREGTVRKCDMLVTLVDGDIDSFSAFTKFVHSLMFHWFKVLVQRSMCAPAEDTRAAPGAGLTRLMAAVAINDQAPSD